MSWLSQLPKHPIFSLPLPSEEPFNSSSTTGEIDSTTTTLQTGLGSSSRLPSIFPTTTTPSTPSLAASASKKSFHLSTSTSNSPLSQSRNNNNKNKKLHPSHHSSQSQVQEEKLLDSFKRNQKLCLIRGGTELIVAVGKELRWCDLKQVKSNATTRSGSGFGEEEEEGEEDYSLGEYKVLNPVGAKIDFEIHQISVNQTSKLLSIVGVHSLRVIELPRKSPSPTSSSSATMIDVRCLEIGKFYHSLPGSSKISQVLWHPLGTHSSSLLVLTEEDCKLREYTLHEQVDEPSQVLSFLNETEQEEDLKKGRGGARFFSAEDEGARQMTGMCLGEGGETWEKMTVWGLMKNGDVRSICPFLPKRSTLSKNYLLTLQSLVSTKLDQLSSTTYNSTSTSLTKALSTKSSLSRSSDHPESSSASSFPSSRNNDRLEKRFSLELQFLQTLLRQIPNREDNEEEEGGEFLEFNSPISRPSLQPIPSGPYLFSPSTTELSNTSTTVESPHASDIISLSIGTSANSTTSKETESVGGGEGEGLGILLIVYSDGKMEVCLQIEKPQPKFKGEFTSQALVLRSRGAGGVLEEEEEEEEELPILWVSETLDLGYLNEVPKGKEGELLDEGRNWPILKRDPLYANGNDSTTVWIYSRFGVQCFVLGDRVRQLWEKTLEEGEGKEVEDGKGEGGDSQVYWVVKTTNIEDQTSEPIVGLEILNDVYLGYSLLAITKELQLVGIELSLRVEQDLLPSTTTDDALTIPTSQSKSYVSLLEPPFTLPQVFTTKPNLPPPSSSKDSLSITPDSLRQLGTLVETYQTLIRNLVQGVDTVSNRLELQFKELSRQLSSLQELRRLSGDLRESTTGVGGDRDGLVGRMKRVEENQFKLLERLDKTLQKLMERHQGSDRLSLYEKKWFEELKRIEKQVGAGGSSAGGLENKVKRVEAMWKELKPGVEELSRKKQQQAATPSKGPGGLGSSQIKGLEERLSQEAKLLADAKKKVERLTHSLAQSSI
ncbi:hypothetical protein JCM5350_000749 [Sporobolomyces pararoseus]